jgi:hypothetical protein
VREVRLHNPPLRIASDASLMITRASSW